MIRHIVFFSCKEPSDRERVREGLALLKQIPAARRLEVAFNEKIDGFGNEIDVVVYGEFENEAALATYKSHPLYARSIEIVRPLRDIRVAADVVAG